MNDTIAEELVYVASELAHTIRDFGPEVTAEVLAKVSPDQMPAFAVVLAAMIDVDKRPSELLAWTKSGPVTSREFVPTVLREERQKRECDVCGFEVARNHYAEHRRAQHGLATPRAPMVTSRRNDIRHLYASGLSQRQVAEQLDVHIDTVRRHLRDIRREEGAVA